MREVPISKFKRNCFSILERVRKTRKPVRITRYDKVLAEIVPFSSPSSRRDWLGCMEGKIDILGDIVSPVIDLNEIEAPQDRVKTP
jgi:prevent-host-death family protein